MMRFERRGRNGVGGDVVNVLRCEAYTCGGGCEEVRFVIYAVQGESWRWFGLGSERAV